MISNSELQKQRIMNAAKKVIMEQGYNKLTLRQVAAEAGISPGTLYYYYKSKNMILYDIVDQSTREAVSLAKDLKSNPWTREEVYSRQLEMLKRRVQDINGNKLFLHLVYEALSGDEELATKIKDKYESWRESFEDILVMYFDIPRGPMSRAWAIILDAMVDGLCLKHLLNIDTIDDAGVEHFFRLYYAGRFDELWHDIKEGVIPPGTCIDED